ncbi:MAG: RibD family protein [Gammaproteobacteria bacterium]
MQKHLLRLYPQPCQEIPLKGLYLAHKLHELGAEKKPFVYANFLSSLDGRIALEDAKKGTTYIPKHLTTDSDFQLFMELHAQSDCLITHGGYMRALGEGRLGNILQIKDAELSEWRRSSGLAAQPDVIIASASLNFPLHESLNRSGQKIYIATGQKASLARVKAWRKRGYPVILAGNNRLVHGAALIRELGRLGYRCIYLIAGPQMLDTVVRERQLFRLYLTITHQLMAGKDFRTLLTGNLLGTEGNLLLSSLYYEGGSPAGSGQFFTRFELKPLGHR